MRKHNFCAGPAALPTWVLQQAQTDLLDYKGKGLSVMEMSHRGDDFIQISQASEEALRRLLNIPQNYKVLFLQGGASLQFSAIPLNLAYKEKGKYLVTGIWSEKAYKEANRLGVAELVATSKDSNFTQTVKQSEIDQLIEKGNGAYLHYTSNETIGGVAFDYVPKTDLPLICDMSSDILSKPIDVSKYALIYAGAQKNIGPAGLTIVIVRDDLLEIEPNPNLPVVMNYKTQAENGSMYNTPATYSWYLAGLVFEWLETQVGGLEAMHKINQAKAQKLYDFIDASDFYSNNVLKSDRSIMNIPFVLRDDSLNKEFLAGAESANLLYLKGHRSVGGMRASIYNAVEMNSIDALLDFMQDFAAKN